MSRAKRILALAIENNKEKNCIRSLNVSTPLPLNVIAIDDNDSRMLSAVDNVIKELIEVPNMRLTNNMEHSYKSPTSDKLSTEPSSQAERVITLLNEQSKIVCSDLPTYLLFLHSTHQMKQPKTLVAQVSMTEVKKLLHNMDP
ncbi:hypothetical protein JTB14_030613 [Gonioctena quinquepunctata]|nr:hypothetical protein JTB14_030613 [Gonioctena quinquepunctata]